LDSRTGDLGTALEGLRRGADRALQLGVPEPEAGLASGILIGLRDRVDRDLSAAFTAVGATHVVAISGWNIAIVATTLAALAGRLARRRRVALTALAIITYVAFVGPSPSVVRAAVMAGVVMLARELGRPSRAAAAIGWAVVALLMVDPTLVADVGFQLSALATVGLIAWGTPFSARLAGRDPGRLRGWLAESLGVSLAAQLATLPIVVLSFGRLSLVSPVVNLAVVPLVAPAMGAGVVALAGGLLAMAGLPAVVATIVGLPAWLLFSLMVGAVRAGALLPFASVQLVEPWNLVIAGVAALGIGAVTILARTGAARSAGDRPAHGRGVQRAPGPKARRPASWWSTRAGRIVVAGLAGSVVAMSVVMVHRPDGIPKVTVLDVGQGDAILVEGGRGGRLLVDGGPDPSRLLVALDEHLPPWDRRIDLVILSHPHEDHAAGLAALLQRYEVDRVLEPGMFGPGPGYAALNAELATIGIARGSLSTGNRFAIDEFRFRVLWPDPGTVPERPPDNGTGINNVSIVLLGEVNGHRLLLAGDIEEQIDPQLLARGLPTVDFLKVAHHGSRTASTGPMIQALQPSVAVISAGRGNPYGHPAAATVERLGASGAKVLRTDLSGSVTVELGSGPPQVRVSGARAATGDVARTALSPSGGAVASRIPFLCGLPPPSPGILVLGSPVAPSDVPAAPIQIWNFIPRADLPGRLG
ncbi:MAG: ComEC/Rec2 family competence protein, partial [Chloroflexota bacterium]